jgi:hypothetical protein
MQARSHRSHAQLFHAALWSALAAISLAPAGCALGQLFGGMAASAERQGSHAVPAKYRGLTGKSFAVIFAADRSIQSEYPQIVTAFTRELTRRLAENAGASGVLPADEVLAFQFQRPGWVALSPQEVAKELEVERLVFIDLTDFALNEPGNQYEWRGVAAGAVTVIEAEGDTYPVEKFRENIRVKFPDHEGGSQDNMQSQTVLSELSRRFVERSGWLFYDHEEANVIKY